LLILNHCMATLILKFIPMGRISLRMPNLSRILPHVSGMPGLAFWKLIYLTRARRSQTLLVLGSFVLFSWVGWMISVRGSREQPLEFLFTFFSGLPLMMASLLVPSLDEWDQERRDYLSTFPKPFHWHRQVNRFSYGLIVLFSLVQAGSWAMNANLNSSGQLLLVAFLAVFCVAISLIRTHLPKWAFVSSITLLLSISWLSQRLH
jgi:hypothetical protein